METLYCKGLSKPAVHNLRAVPSTNAGYPSLCLQNYPFEAPLVRFETACFHPNVDNAGNICLDILKEHWSAAYSVRTILISIQVGYLPCVCGAWKPPDVVPRRCFSTLDGAPGAKPGTHQNRERTGPQ